MVNISVVRDIDVSNYSNAWGAISMNIYYVYAYLRKSNLTPYYITLSKMKAAATLREAKKKQEKLTTSFGLNHSH